MANYNIDIKAKVNVSQVRQSIREELAKTTIRVAPKFDVFADDNHIKQFRNQVASILERQPVPITLAEPTRDNVVQILGEINKKFIITPTLKFSTDKGSEFIAQLNTIKQAIDDFGKNSKAKVSFDVDPESYNQLFKILDSIKQKQNIKFGFSYNEQEVQKLSDLFHDLDGGIKELDKGAIEISFAPISDEYLVPIKTKIDQYFKENPITLTIAETTGGIDLKSLIEPFQEYQKTIKAITVDGLENQRASLRIQANDLKEYYNRGITSAQEYRDKLKALLEDQQNDAILSAKGSAKTREDLARELSRIEVQIAVQTKAEQEKIQQAITDNWKKSIDDAFESLQSGGSFKKFQKELESLKENGLHLNISDAQEYYDKVLKDGTEYITNLKEQNKQIGTMKGEMTKLFNLVSEGKVDISEWDDKIEKWKSKDIFKTEQVQEHFTKLSSTIDALYEAMLEKQKKAQEEEEKEIELLQEQVHLRSEIRSSMFEDIDSGTNTQQQALDEKKQEFENYLNSLKIVQQNTVETTQILNKAFNEDIQNIFRNYQRHTTDFEALNNDFWKRVKTASEQGVSEDVIQKAQDRFTKIADAHQKSVDKINQQQEQANQKAEQERQKEEQRIVKYLEDTRNKILKEQQEEERQREQAWNKEAQDLQEKYNKQLISTEDYIERMEVLVKQGFDNGYDKANHYSNSLEQVKKKQEKAGQSADNLRNKVNKLGSGFDKVFNSLMRYFGVTKIFDAVQNSFSKMVQEVRDLDVELTEFSKVTDLSAQETEKFIDSAYRLGDKVARTGTEVVKATTLFKKMGYEVGESMKFAEDALMWTNVADGMVGVEDAATMLISTMKAFEDQGVSSTHVIDALNEVSNNYSTSSSALSENLSVVAATLATSGTSFEQMVGLMTAGIEIMPDRASKVANGLKTISQRIRQIDGDTADKLDAFFGEKGISRFDEFTGQLRGTYDILYDVSKIWGTLTENEKQFIGETMAGKNQITVLNALMMNFSTAISATETALNSAGSAARENERVLDSIQGHIQRFQSAFEELSHNLIDSNVFKQVVDFGTNLIKILNALVEDSGRLIALLSGAGIITAISAWQKFNNGFTQTQQNIQKFNDELQQAQQRGENLDKTFKNFQTRGEYFRGIIGDVKLLISEIGIGISLLTALYQHYQNLYEERKKEFQDNINDRNKEADLIKQLKNLEQEYLETDIKDTEKRNQLFQKIYDKKVEIANLDNDGLSRTELLTGAIGEQNQLYDNQLVKVAKTTLELERQKQILEEVNKGNLWDKFLGLFPNSPQNQENLNPFGDTYSDEFFGGKNYQDFVDTASISLQDKIDTLTSLQEYIKKSIDTLDPGDEFYDLYRRQYEFLGEKIEELKGKNEGILNSSKAVAQTVLGDLSTYTEEQLKAMEEVFDAYSNFGISGAEGLQSALENLIEVFGSDLEDNFLQEIQENLSDPDIAQAASDLINIFLMLQEEAKKASSEIEHNFSYAMGEVLNIYTNTATGLQEQYDTLAQAVDEFNKSGVITKETLQSLTENDLLQYLEIVNGELVLNEEAFYGAADSALVKASADIDEKVNAEIAAMANDMLKKSLDDVADATTGASQGIDNAAGAASDSVPDFMNAGSSAEVAALAVKYLKSEGENVEIDTSGLEKFQTEAQKLIDNANELKKKLGSFTPSASRGSSSSRSGGSSGSGSSSSRSSTSTSDREAEKAQREAEQAAKDAQKAWKDAFEVEYKKLKAYLDDELITYEEYYDALEILNEQFFAGRAEFEEEYWKYKDEAIKGYKKYIEDELKDYFKKGETALERSLEKEEITQEQYFDYLEELYKAYYTDKDEYEEAMAELSHERFMYEKKQREQEIKDLQDQISDLFKHGETLLEHQLAMDEITEEQYYDSLTLLYEAYYDDKEKYEEEYWKLQEKIYAYQKKKRQEELDDLENQLEELYNEAERLHKEYVESLEEENDALETTISYAIDVLDEEIDKLKAEKSALDEANEALSEQIKLQELEDNLEKAKQKKVRVYRKGQGFIYEQDTKAVNEAQSALDEYKKELQHKKQLSMIDEEINKLEEYKKEWRSITENYKKAQDEMTAKGVLGESAREKILAREHSAVELVGRKYENVKDRIKRANEATIEDMAAYIGDENTANTLSYEIKKIKDKINEVKGKTVTVGVQPNSNIETIINNIKGKMDEVKNKTASISVTDDASSTITNIISEIDTLKRKLEQSYSTQNMTNWLTKWKDTIDQAYSYSKEHGITPSAGDGDGDGDSGHSGDSGGRTDGYSVGDWVTIPDSDIEYAPFRGKRFKIVQFENQDQTYNPTGDYVALLVEGGTEGEVTYRVPVSHLNGGSDTTTESGSGDGPAGKTVVSREPREGWIEPGKWGVVGYEITYSDGTKMYEEVHARGTLGTTSKTFMVNEDGMEAMVTPEGTVISAPSTGYGVIKNEYTERLTDFAADPMSFLNKTFSGYSGTYKNNSSSNETININGNLTLPNVTDGQSFVDSIRNVALQYTTRRK